MSRPQHSFHADRYGSSLFASLWIEALGEQYPVEVAPFSSCTLELLEELERQINAKPGMALVDLGCGIGGVGLWFARKHLIQLIGIDRCPDAISIANERSVEWGLSKRAKFETGDFCNTGVKSDSADVVISIDAFTATEDIESALREVRRILKPEGVFVFTARELSVKGRHFQSIGPDWRKGLEKNGFSDVCIINRPNVSNLWKNVYSQWLKYESDLRKELLPETVDALIAEAHTGIPSMNENRPWYLIRAAISA